MLKRRILPHALSLLSAAMLAASVNAQAQGDAKAVMAQTCAACHSSEKEGEYTRIDNQRKTPEGWLMTIARMQVMHGLKISDEDRRTVVKYLADRQGLAPSETEGARYALERRLNTFETFESQQFTETCARCHSGARVELQRRPAEEWEHLVHFHLGQWPSLEYQAQSRDRDWLPLALNEMVPELAAQLPLKSDAWTQWQKADKPQPAGQWRLAGHMPGRGSISGVMKAEAKGDDVYGLSFEGSYADGTPVSGKGQAIVYTGYEWRGELEIDGTPMRQVFALAGGRLEGRMFEVEHDEVGFDISGARIDGGEHALLALQPSFLKSGETAELTMVGTGLEGQPDFGDGVEVEEVLASSATEMRVRVKVADGASGVRQVRVGDSDSQALSLYDRIDSVRVVPDYSVSRIGDNGGSAPKVYGLFDAEAWSAGADGESGTADDYRIGVVPAKWHVEPFDERAAEDQDVKFAGVMDAATGRFTPGGAGPNPERRMSTNNAGNLKVVAEVADGDRTVTGSGQMIVTVQRWNNPPIP